MSEKPITASEKSEDSGAKFSEAKALTDGHGIGSLQLSEVRQLNARALNGSDWVAVTDEKKPVARGVDDGRDGFPEDSPAFKAYERLNPKIESQFPGHDEKSEELKRAALGYVMNKEGFGTKLKPEQLELLRKTPGVLEKLDKISFDDMYPIHLNTESERLYRKN